VSRAARTGAAVFALCLVCAPAATAGPRPGERYDGRSATGNRGMVTVSSDGSRLQRYFLGARMRCTDGERRSSGLNHRGERPVRIDAAGAFAYRSRAYPWVHDGARGRVRISFTGSFDASGDTVSGTVEATFRSRRFDCSSGPVAYTLHRNGSAGAPYRDALMATGLYTARGRGVTARLRTHAPARGLIRGTILFRARCPSGALRAGREFRRYPIRPSGRLRVSGRFSFRDRDTGVKARVRYRLALRFFGGTQVSGAWRVRAVLTQGQARETCRMNRSFRGSFVRGPV
jgi:hypothetical protein